MSFNQILSDFYLWCNLAPYTWFALLVLASALDAATTVYALHRGGVREANPVMRWLMQKCGIAIALWLLKGMPLLVLFFSLQDHILYVPLAVLLFAGVAAWNVAVIYRHPGF